jgi:formylmethanofuran dehydrogenase subunit D
MKDIMGKIDVKLITGRVIEQGVLLENKMSDEYLKVAAVCELNEDDMDVLSIKEGDRVCVKSAAGEVSLLAKKGDGNPKGIAFIPMGPWANVVVDPNTGGSGTPGYKGIDVEITRTGKDISSVGELMSIYLEGE